MVLCVECVVLFDEVGECVLLSFVWVLDLI